MGRGSDAKNGNSWNDAKGSVPHVTTISSLGASDGVPRLLALKRSMFWYREGNQLSFAKRGMQRSGKLREIVVGTVDRRLCHALRHRFFLHQLPPTHSLTTTSNAPKSTIPS